MRVKRIIEKEVTCCRDCPYFEVDHDMNASSEYCGLMQETNPNIREFPDIFPDRREFSPYKEISKHCPYKERKR